MIGFKSWSVVFLLYLIVAFTIFLSAHGSPRHHSHHEHSFSFPSLDKRESTQEVFLNIHELGISGKGLIRLFKRHILPIISVDQKEKAKAHQAEEVEVSQFYDLFRRYIYNSSLDDDDDEDGDNNRKKTRKCSPSNSIVSKLTKGVDPLPIHSHNDYWRSLPLFEALALGCSSVEADVWIVPENLGDDEDRGDGDISKQFALAVGHNEAYLDTLHQTLDKLYTKPLGDMLDQVNCLDTSKRNGVFFNSPETTLFLYIDFKSKDSEMTYRLLMDKYLKPLIDSEYLSFYDTSSDKIVYNQLAIILTGDYPRELKVIDNGNGDHGYFYNNKRYAFLDADLLSPETAIPNTSITSSVSFTKLLESCRSSRIKTLWRGRLIHPEINCMSSHIAENHNRGLKTRIWGVPSWPDRTAKTLWRQQIFDLHSDLLSVDNLFLATSRF